MDLMGSDLWGAEGEWGGEQSWEHQEYGNEQWGGYEGTGYLRSSATLAEAPVVSVKNSFDALADQHDSPIDVPILVLVVTSKRKISNKARNKTKTIDNKCDCSSHPTTSAGPGRCPPTPLTMGGTRNLQLFMSLFPTGTPSWPLPGRSTRRSPTTRITTTSASTWAGTPSHRSRPWRTRRWASTAGHCTLSASWKILRKSEVLYPYQYVGLVAVQICLAGTPRADLAGHRPLDHHQYAGHLFVLRRPQARHNCEVNSRPTTPGFHSRREAEPPTIFRTRSTSIRTSKRRGIPRSSSRATSSPWRARPIHIPTLGRTSRIGNGEGRHVLSHP